MNAMRVQIVVMDDRDVSTLRRAGGGGLLELFIFSNEREEEEEKQRTNGRVEYSIDERLQTWQGNSRINTTARKRRRREGNRNRQRICASLLSSC